MIKLNGVEVKPTIFPDGTSQVWKLDKDLLASSDQVIEWEFENEAEFFQVMQLAELCRVCTYGNELPVLNIPFFPYARQDKSITNQSTFALRPFLRIIADTSIFRYIQTVDIHNPISIKGYDLIKNLMPDKEIHETIRACQPDLICFPDVGAANRGYNTFDISSFNLDKKRDPLTGEIEGLLCKLPLDLTGKSILILDDICDGGKTFIEAAKVLYNMGASEVNLFTTHGIYSKGTDVLKESGIKRIFNRKGEV